MTATAIAAVMATMATMAGMGMEAGMVAEMATDTSRNGQVCNLAKG